MAKVAVLVVHGIGWHDDGSAEGPLDRYITGLMDPPASVSLLRKALAAALPEIGHTVALAHWGLRLEPIQKRFEARYADLRWTRARRVAISALGDAAQYQAAVYSAGRQMFPAHDAIHAEVKATLASLAEQCGADAPLVAVGHSLGAHILSNHVYDQQKAPPRHGGESPLERLETLTGIATLGCNIPLFVMGAEAPQPIELRGARWRNFYDPDDVLGFPIEPLYFPDGKPSTFDLEDVRVEVGGPITGRTPLSHGYYWDHPTVVSGIARMIRDAAQSARPS